MKTKRIAIIGAGPTGLTAGHQINKNSNYEVVVFESDKKVGGLAKSFRLWDQIVDIGPHRFFSNDSKINQFFTSVPDIHFNQVDRKTRIFFNGTFIDYPLDMINIVSSLPLSFSTRVLLDFGFNKLKKKSNSDPSFESEMVHRFGPYLFNQFFKGYTERLWGETTDQLSKHIVQQRIGKFNLLKSLNQLVQKKSLQKHDSFYYPENGAGQVWEHLADDFVKDGGVLRTNHPIESIETKGPNELEIKSFSGTERFDWVISTMPFDQLKQMTGIGKVQDSTKTLRFRSTIFIYVLIEGSNPFPDQWIYINQPDLEVGRISNFSNWRLEPNGKGSHVLCLELWCTEGDNLWNYNEEKLVKIAQETLDKLPRKVKISESKVIKIADTYPIYYKGFEKHRVEGLSQFFEKGIIPLGRGGSYSYINQDICIKMGLTAAECIISNDLKGLEAFLQQFDSTYIEENKKEFKNLPPA